MSLFELAALGAVAGFTIFLGLPVALMRIASPALQRALNYCSAGILLYIIYDVAGEALEISGEKILEAMRQGAPSLASSEPLLPALGYALLLVGGIALGFLGPSLLGISFGAGHGIKNAGLSDARVEKTALLIAIGIGLHNFSEGLAIGQSHAAGRISLALTLAAGFALHNATEGFCIAAPLAGRKAGWKYIALLGIVGGGPTFVGALLGGNFQFEWAELAAYSLAAGAIVYVVGQMAPPGRIRADGAGALGCLAIGFFLGFATGRILSIAMA